MLVPAVLVLAAVSFAAEDAVTVPTGATLAIRLERSISATHIHPGDEVEATLLAPIVAGGVVVVPRNARIVGHAIAVEPRSKRNDSRLLIRFEQAQWRDQSAPLNAYVVRQLATREVVQRRPADSTCPSISNLLPSAPLFGEPWWLQVGRRKGDDSAQTQVPKFEAPPCFDKLTTGAGKVDDRMVFTSPPLKDMQLEKLAQPAGATEFVSHKKNIELARGTMFELVQAGP